jgi:hypothetical protein
MALPKLEVPTYELELPLSKKKIKYRPFLVKEQKNLLMAMESEDAVTIQHNVREILNVCTLTTGINIDELPIIDVEYYFINLRAKSVGEIVESKYRCNNEVDDGEGGTKTCNNIMEAKIDLTDIKPVFEKEVDPEIRLTDKVVVKMRYPQYGIIKDSLEMKNLTEVTFNMLAESIEYIYDGEQFYYAKESTKEEMMEFLEQLSQPQFEKIEEFFEAMPRMSKKINMKCKKCGFQHELEAEGIESFFAF